VAPFVERPISAMRLAQTLLGLKLPRYAALANPVEPVQVVVRLTVKQSGDAPPVSFVKTYDKYLNVPVAGIPQDGPWPHTVFPTPSSSMRLEVGMPVAISWPEQVTDPPEQVPQVAESNGATVFSAGVTFFDFM
jgi:hypothetical protein